MFTQLDKTISKKVPSKKFLLNRNKIGENEKLGKNALFVTESPNEPAFGGLNAEKICRYDNDKDYKKRPGQNDESEMFSQWNKRDHQPDRYDIDRGKDQHLAGLAFHEGDLSRANDVDNERLRA